MRFTTRIILGLGLVSGVLLAGLLHQLSVVERLQGINAELSNTNLEVARLGVSLLQGTEGVREFAQKAILLEDPEYRAQWQEWEEASGGRMEELAQVPLPPLESRLRDALMRAWDDYRAETQAGPMGIERLSSLETSLDEVRARIEALLEGNEEAIAARVEASQEAGARAQQMAWSVAAAALVLATGVGLLLFLSISGPLRRLNRGTRELARGRLEHRLEISGPRELSEVAHAFNGMAERLDELEELKRDFVSHVSHELKTPLAAVQETIELLLDELPGPLTHKQRHLLELSRGSAGRLSEMVGKLLEVSRLESDAELYLPRPMNLDEVVGAVVAEVTPLAKEGRLTLTLGTSTGGRSGPESIGEFSANEPLELQMVGDAVRIRDVVTNLVTNALKFSPPGGQVEVTASRYARPPAGLPPWVRARLRHEAPPFLHISVADEGEGVPLQERERIFEKFHQAGRRRIHGQGVGLGLAITRRVVEAHGGAVWVEDAPGGGALFRVLLPAQSSRWGQGRLSGDGPLKQSFSRRELPPGPRTVGTAGVAILALMVGACASLPGMGGTGDSLPAETGEADSAVLASEPVLSPADRLNEGRRLLREADPSARAHFLALLEEEVRYRPQALWGLALSHLPPMAGAEERALARAYLLTLVQDHPDSPESVPGATMTFLLEQLAASEVQARQLGIEAEELKAALERLRQIDLERRPGRVPPRDTTDVSF
ncbi:MAG: HAMP domain-containing sensor histidine kinase [Gemmatimonadota bacterium]